MEEKQVKDETTSSSTPIAQIPQVPNKDEPATEIKDEQVTAECTKITPLSVPSEEPNKTPENPIEAKIKELTPEEIKKEIPVEDKKEEVAIDEKSNEISVDDKEKEVAVDDKQKEVSVDDKEEEVAVDGVDVDSPEEGSDNEEAIESSADDTKDPDEEVETKREKSAKSNDTRLNPVKKGEFFEHDNRDDTDSTSTPEKQSEPKQPGKKKPAKKAPKEKGADNEVAAGDGNKGDKWTHDLFEKGLDDKLAKKPQQSDQQAKKKPQNRRVPAKTVPSTPESSKKPKDTAKKPEKPTKAPNKDTGDKKTDSTGNKSKGLSLSEYLEQGDGSLKATNKPRQPQQQKKAVKGVNNDPKKPQELAKRLDFSTRKPITSENFINTKPAEMVNLKITTNLDSSKRIVTEGAAQMKGPKQRTYFTDEDISSYPHTANYRHPNNRAGKGMASANFNEQEVASTAVRPGGMKKSHTSHLIASNSKSKDDYDEYYFNEYDVDPNDYSQQQISQEQQNRMTRPNRRPFKGQDQDQFSHQYPLVSIDPSNLHIFHHSQQNQQQPRRHKNQSNYNEYIDYSAYNQNDFSEYNDQSSKMYPIHQGNFMTKSHSFHNSQINRNNNHFMPQHQPQPVHYEFNSQVRMAKPQNLQQPINRTSFPVFQQQTQSNKNSSRIRFDPNQAPFTPSFSNGSQK